MSDTAEQKLSDLEFAQKVEWEGDLLEAVMSYGLTSRVLVDTTGALYRTMAELDQLVPKFQLALYMVEEALERALETEGADTNE